MITSGTAGAGDPVDRRRIHDALEQTRASFRVLVEGASPEDLRRPSEGTRWTNRRLLFHMLLGHLVVRRLLWLVRVLGVLPPWAGRVLHRRTALPTTWDPCFRETMSLADVYRLGFLRFEHHGRQLTLRPPPE